jgi:acetyltransferase-like isoleucine patch superfamily enzyme
VAETRIEIGNRVLLGSNVVVMDTDFHPLDAKERARGASTQRSEPVRIEDDVFVGTQALILKGVTIGRGAVIGAASVVTRDVPAWTIVAGNPARPRGRVPGGGV